MKYLAHENMEGKKTVLVVGGGFAGLSIAKKLSHNSKVHVILIDKRNHHLFQPLLYQVATAGLNSGDIAAPIRSQFKGVENVEVHLGEVEKVNLTHNTVNVGEHVLNYNYLVLACGAQHSYFGHSEWEEFAPGLKTLEQATEIRRRILTSFEIAENEEDAEKRKALMTFVVVGGGPTGVELAGAIADISRTVLHNDFKRIDTSTARVILIEAGSRVLSSFAESLSKYAERDLKAIGVEVLTSTRVEKIDADGVSFGERKINSKVVFWAAGVQAAAMNITPEVIRDRSGRITVEKDFSIPQYSNVFVIGDMASAQDADGTFLPGVSPAAIQAGRYVAKIIAGDIKGIPRKDFKYVDKGQMATIGKNRAIAQIGRLKLTGRAAWLAWLFVHIFYLIGFKNRISVMFQWAWSYIFSKRGSRLITEREWKLKS